MTLLSGKVLQTAIENRPFPKITKEYIESRIKSTFWFVIADTTVTICHIELDNGYSVRGESACVDSRNYDKTIGESNSYIQAFNKLWPLFGFLLYECSFTNTPMKGNFIVKEN
jgi:hypothetical protein